MPRRFAHAQEHRDHNRSANNDVPILAAAEIPYRVVHAIAPRPTYQQYSKQGSSSTSTYHPTSSVSYPPYRQRLVAAALAVTEDPHSSNDSSSAPSSNAVSSGVGTSSATSGSSVTRGKAKLTSAPIPSAPRLSPASTSLPAHASAEEIELDPDSSCYDQLMMRNASSMPAPGMLYYERRRALWLTSPPNPPRPASPSPSRIKLEALLGQAGAVESEEVWRAGLKNVWKGLVGGNQLRKRLPLAIVLKILQAGWLRDGTWPEGMVAPSWEQPTHSLQSPAPLSDNSVHTQSPRQRQERHEQMQAQQQRYAHEQEAYAAALHARANAEQASGTAQMMHMQAYAMMGMGGIPPGYSPSSGDAPEEGYYAMPYAYSEATPPLSAGEGVPERERDEGPPPTPVHEGQVLESEMDTEDEAEDDEDASRMEGVMQTGDGRHEGG